MNETANFVEAMPPAPAEPERAAAANQLPEARWEIIRFCVQLVKSLGVPGSVGEIFGYVFTSARPVTFEEIVSSLGISNGSASHGLRKLNRIGALNKIYVARDRRDHFIAESSLRRLFLGYLLENFSHHLSSQRERLAAMRSRYAEETDVRCGHLPERLDTLLNWLQLAGDAFTAAAQTLQAPTSAPLEN